MSLSRLASASTQYGGGNIPSALLETFIPGYSHVHSFFLSSLKIDITNVVTKVATVWALSELGQLLWSHMLHLVREHYMSSITIPCEDELHSQIQVWLIAQPGLTARRFLIAQSIQRNSRWPMDLFHDENAPQNSLYTEKVKGLSYHEKAKIPPNFLPGVGFHIFRHKSRFFLLHRKLNDQQYEMRNMSPPFMIYCFGRDPQPAKGWIMDVKAYNASNTKSTLVHRPAQDRYSGPGNDKKWKTVARLQKRNMDTVVMDAEKKEALIKDVESYLNPITRRWYLNRGIPYRRGYLFHGPPGTGKSSFTLALAGFFDLDIYSIALKSLHELDLNSLFTALPRHCIVLLEDIDSAGISREEMTKESSSSNPTEGIDNSHVMLRPDIDAEGIPVTFLGPRHFRNGMRNGADMEMQQKAISLSGLLNVIDEVASAEGRILIMTTNILAGLDPALLRPGRVDYSLGFENASHYMARELFVEMFTVYPEDVESSPASISASQQQNGTTSNSLSPCEQNQHLLKFPAPRESGNGTTNVNGGSDSNDEPKPNGKANGDLTLHDYAALFATKIPEHVFSPAEIQGFLIQRMNEPARACAEIDGWVGEMMKEKEDRKVKNSKESEAQ